MSFMSRESCLTRKKIVDKEIIGVGHQLYHQIRSKILGLEFEFGERINLKSLCKEFNVSVTPVREAINKLIEDGLIKCKPRRGYYVYSPTPKDVKEIYELRKTLELYALSLLKDNFYDLHLFQEFKKRIEYIKKQPQRERKNKFAETEDIHTLIVYTLSNRRVRNIYDNLHNFTLLFQRIIQHNVASITDTGLREHLALANAVLHRDIDEARKIVKKHNDTAANILCRLLTRDYKKIFPL